MVRQLLFTVEVHAKSMPEQEDIIEQQRLLQTHRRTLAHYLNQQAILGTAYTPPGVAHGIIEARENIRSIKKTLRGWGMHVDDLPNEEDTITDSTPKVVSLRRVVQDLVQRVGDLIPLTELSSKDLLIPGVNRLDFIGFKHISSEFAGGYALTNLLLGLSVVDNLDISIISSLCYDFSYVYQRVESLKAFFDRVPPIAPQHRIGGILCFIYERGCHPSSIEIVRDLVKSDGRLKSPDFLIFDHKNNVLHRVTDPVVYNSVIDRITNQ